MKRIFISMMAGLVCVAGLWAQAAQPAPAAKPAQAGPKQPQPKSQKEVVALQALFGAKDPDSRIKAAEALITGFADTEFKAIALSMETESYMAKGDFENMVIYGERVLKVDPKNFQVKLLLAESIAQRTRENDLDKEEKLKTVDKYVADAMAEMKDAAKPNPQLSDDQWNNYKKAMEAQGHSALGMGAMARKKYDVAAAEFKAAVEAAKDPAAMVRQGSALNEAGKYDEAIVALDQAINFPNVHAQIKQVAESEKARATQLKARGVKPGAPKAAPGVVEIK